MKFLMEKKAPVATAEIARRLRLTPRQVNYGLKGIQRWLAAYGEISLEMAPNVGVVLKGSEAEWKDLIRALAVRQVYQLVLTPGQRQQLIALYLLSSTDAVIYLKLRTLMQVSRPTIIRDLDVIEAWLPAFQLALRRKPNFGFAVVGREQDFRQALAALLWGNLYFGDPLFKVTFADGIQFALAKDVHALEMVRYAGEVASRLDISRALRRVALVEAQLGGRFVDESVLYLALSFAIQQLRVERQCWLDLNETTLSWLKTLPVWAAAAGAANWLLPGIDDRQQDSEVGWMAMQLMTASRKDRWPGDVDILPAFNTLVNKLMDHIAAAYRSPQLVYDSVLRDGLIVHLIPACLRQRFGLILPPYLHEMIPADQMAVEGKIAQELSQVIAAEAQVILPQAEINNLAYLLRAASIRQVPNRLAKVYVVCPSGMATVQLLAARLKARFPQLGNFEVVSMREITPAMAAAAQLIITTVPLPNIEPAGVEVIQVHPMLLPDDVEKITRHFA